MSRLTFKQLQDALVERQRLLDPEGEQGGLFFATEHGGEAGEALNKVKKIERNKMKHLRSKTKSKVTINDLALEIADSVITAHTLANHYGIVLEDVIREKFNTKSQEWGIGVKL